MYRKEDGNIYIHTPSQQLCYNTNVGGQEQGWIRENSDSKRLRRLLRYALRVPGRNFNTHRIPIVISIIFLSQMSKQKKEERESKFPKVNNHNVDMLELNIRSASYPASDHLERGCGEGVNI